jgi:hypothetical protein
LKILEKKMEKQIEILGKNEKAKAAQPAQLGPARPCARAA